MTMLADLLHRTSRSFALSIPVAPDPVGHEMTVGYLLFRIADTFEDCTHAPVEQRVAGLHAFCRALLTPGDKTMRRSLREHARHLPERNADYRALLASCDAVLDGLMALRPGAAELVAAHSSRTAAACVDWIRRTDSDGVFRLHSLNELRAYCYAVAGIPGEMLCELFMLDRPELWPVAEDLRERAAVFGEAMQLVNILKDEALDSGEDRVFLPATVATSEALALARRDLAVAREYVDLLRQPGVHPGVVGFHAITCGLAEAALEVTETNGPGAKMSRRCVADVFRGAGISSDHIHEVAR